MLDGVEADLVGDQLLHVQVGDAARRNVAHLQPLRRPSREYCSASLLPVSLWPSLVPGRDVNEFMC
jgi:hypothetical protein